MTHDRTEEELAMLLSLLPAVPEGLSEAAKQLPAFRRALAEVEERVLDGAVERAELTAELEAALRRTGVEPTPELVRAAERHLRAHGDA